MGQTAEGAVAAERAMTPTEAMVARAWADELRLPRVGLDEDFIDLGSHSLQGLAIAARLEEELGIPIPVRTLFEEPTVADLAAWIDRLRAAAQEPKAEIVRLQAGDGSAVRPIFALPGGRGDAQQLYALAKLAREIDPARPMHGFPGDPPVPEATPQEGWIAAAAASVVARVRATQPAGPYLLLGVCAGGVIAWEAAGQLEAAGETVHLLLVDTRNPQWSVGEETFRHAVAESLTAEERRARHRRRREWRRSKAAAAALPPDLANLDGERVSRRMARTRAYQPRLLRGRVTLLVNGDWHQAAPTLGWDGMAAGGIAVGVTDRGHVLDWHIPEVASRVRGWLAEVEQFGEGALPAAPEETGGTIVLAQPATVMDVIARWAQEMPDAPALSSVDGETLDYRRLWGEVERLAADLHELGIRRDDLILIVLPDGPAMALAILAAMTAGIAAPFSAAMTRHEHDGMMRDGVARAVILLGGASPAWDAATAAGLPVFEFTAPAGERATYRIIGAPVGPPTEARLPRPDDVALVISSSGTTGRPKRIPRTHRNIAATSADVMRLMQTSARERCLNLAPMAFSQGLNALLNTLWAGGSVVALPGFDLARLPERIAAFRPTWFSATPTVLRAIATDEAASAAVRTHPPRLIRASAGAISAGEIALLEERFGAPVLHSYGMSEASYIAGEPFGAARRKPGSAGLANYEVEIRGDDGHPLPPGETGEIVTRGPNVFPGYLNDPAANAAVLLPDGWFRTGDVGRVDEDGFLFVTGRLKEMIKRGGVSIGPLEIEEALRDDPAVAEACVFGVPHPELGEDVAAAVVLRPGALATERGLRHRVAALLSPAKTPRHIVFVTEIPKTETGKAQRGELAAAVAAVLTPGSEKREPPTNVDAPDDLTARIASIWAGILGGGTVAGDDDLFDLGADSLQVARMHVELEQQFGIALPAGLLFEERTPARTATWVAARLADADPVASPAAAKRPIFFVTSASGGKNPLRPARLGGAIDPERPMHDLAVPARLIAPNPDDRDEAARTAGSCIATARAEQPHGPYLLAGIAEGGVIACEMARQWEQAGETVHLLLIESRNLAATPPPDTPFGGLVTVIATPETLAEDAGLGWGTIFGERVRVVPIAGHERPRRMQMEVAGAMRAWLEEVDRR